MSANVITIPGAQIEARPWVDELPLELRSFLDRIPTIAWSALPDGSLDFCNQPFRDYTCLSPEQFYGSEWKSAVHRDDLPRFETWWQDLRQSQEAGTTEVRLRRFDGSSRWFLVFANPLRDESGHIFRWYGTNIDIEDRKRAEENLRARELSWRQIVDNIPGLVATMGAMGEVEFLNRQILEYFGKTSEELKDWALIDVVHPDDLPRVIEARIESIEEGRIYSVEHRCRRADGVYRWFQVRGLPVRNAEDAITAWYLLLTDIDDRKRAEEAIRRSEAYLAEAQRLSHTGSFGWRPDSGEIVWSDETYRIFAYDNTLKPTVDSVLQRVHPDDRALAQQVIDGACQTGSDFAHEYRLLMPDERVKHVHAIARALKDASGNCEFVGAVTDITERKTAEEKIREQEMELRQMLDLAPQSVAVFGPGGERLYANRRALDYHGLSLEEWRQTPGGFFLPGWFIHPDDRERAVRGYSDSTRSGGSAYELEQRVQGADGGYRWFLVRFNPVHDEQGKITRWYVAATDIDDQKRTEEQLRTENLVLREEIDRSSMFEEIVGSCKPMQHVLKQVEKVAPSDSTVLILGETGTGKELIARALHRRSRRANRVFVRVNCAAIPQSLIASELFGHEKGAFTGALQRRLGRFEAANGGTLFLDEIGDLPMETQIALLRVLQEREFERVGSNHPISVDVRLIAATNRDLTAAVADGIFRQDLFYRLNVMPIAVPPLRERVEDIPLLVEYFVARYAKEAGKNIRHISKRNLDQLKHYHWPGNIRELQNVIERAVILGDGDTFDVDESWLRGESAESPQHEGLSALANREVEMIEAALAECHGRISGPSGAAAKLGIPRQTLDSKIRRLGIDKYGQKRPTSK